MCPRYYIFKTRVLFEAHINEVEEQQTTFSVIKLNFRARTSRMYRIITVFKYLIDALLWKRNRSPLPTSQSTPIVTFHMIKGNVLFYRLN